MSDETDITKKIKETKRQTEELKAQLQNLIDKGKNLVCPSQSKLLTSNNDEEEPVKSPNKVQIMKSYHQHSKQKPDNSDIPKMIANADSLKKSRTYDVKEAREYIKKQKERRMEQSKNQEEAKLKAEIQKKKLQQLHKKSLELLAKNVQANRERSKSRDRNMYLRPDESTNHATSLRRTKSFEKVHTLQQKNQNLLYPPSPEIKKIKKTTNISPCKKGNIKRDSEKIVIISRNYTRQGTKSLANSKELGNITARHDLNSNAELTAEENSDLKQIENKKEDEENNITTKGNKNKKENLESTAFEKLNPRRLFNNSDDTKDNVETVHYSAKDSVKNILDYKSAHLSHSNVVVRSPTNTENNELEQKENTNLTPKKDKIVSNAKKKYVQEIKQSKEIQTEVLKKEYPKWLEEQPPPAFPFNFINTITRKLQVTADKQKTTTDVGIQNSLLSPSPKNYPATSKGHENSKRDLRSFISHKCLNLDPAGIEHLELVSKENYDVAKKLSPHRSMEIVQTESESDTSKNIPDISSESGTSLKKNKESVRKVFMLNTEKIDDMKLVPHSIANTTTIKTNNHLHSKLVKNPQSENKTNTNTLSVHSPYASDFDSDVEISSEESLNRSRQSIIRFNISRYSKNNLASNSNTVSNFSQNVENNQVSPHRSKSSVNTDMLSNMSKSGDNSKGNKSSNLSIEKNKLKINENRNEQDCRKSKSVSSLLKSDVKDDFKKDSRGNFPLENSESNEKISSISEVSVDKNSVKKSKNRNIVTSSKNSSAETEIKSNSVTTNLSKSAASHQNINTQRGSITSISIDKLDILPLAEPKVCLIQNSATVKSQDDGSKGTAKNLPVYSTHVSTRANANDAHQIHLKFEAEIHLLNDFNESLRRFSALEQALENLKTKNTVTTSNIIQNNDAKTSLTTKSSSTKISGNIQSKKTRSHTSQINFSRGSFINNSIDDDLKIIEHSSFDKDNISEISTGLDISNLNSINQSLSVKSENHLSNFENLQSVNFAGLSLNMFEQLIKDEDARLDNLKTILKIREQALLDRTKGELAWLEIQRKHFKETGKLHEASIIKKKQRGILVNHQKEKHEMQRLKQMQKAASVERKIVLKEQRNLIRQQLSTDNMLTKMKVNIPKERRSSGPLKVLQSNTESIRSETSVTKKSSSDKEKDVMSITSHHSTTHYSTTHHSIVSELSEVELPSKELLPLEHHKYIKRTLLMREEALKKRRKAAEELLQWHKKLLEEEKRIAILESTASVIISQKPSISKSQEKFNFKGKQLNQLWFNLTGSEGKKVIDDKVYPMSQLALERFCKSAREYFLKTKASSASENIPTPKSSSVKDYVSDFDNESIPATENDVVDQSIDILINNFNQIHNDISTLNIIQSRKSDESPAEDFQKSESEAEISVIETNRIRSALVSEKLNESFGSVDDNKETIGEDVPELDNIISEKSRSEEISENMSNIRDTGDISQVAHSIKDNTSDKIKSDSTKQTSSANIVSNASEKSKINSTDSSLQMKLVAKEISFVDNNISKSEGTKLLTKDKCRTHTNEVYCQNNDVSTNLERTDSLKKTNEFIEESVSNKENNSQHLEADSRNVDRNQLINDPEPVILSSEKMTGNSVARTDFEIETDNVIEKIYTIPKTKVNLNASKEILLFLGESEIKSSSDEEILDVPLKDSLTESEEILSKLSQIITDAEEIDEENTRCTENILYINENEQSKINSDKIIEECNEVDSASVREIDDKNDKISSRASPISENKDQSESGDQTETELTGSPIKTNSSNNLTILDEHVPSQLLMKESDFLNISLEQVKNEELETNIDIIFDEFHGVAVQDVSKDIVETVEALMSYVVSNEENSFIVKETNVYKDLVEEQVEPLFEVNEDIEQDDVNFASLDLDNKNLNDLAPCDVESNLYLEESDESKITSDKSNDSFIIKDIHEEISQKNLDSFEESERLSSIDLKLKEIPIEVKDTIQNKSDKDSSVTEEIGDETQSQNSSKVASNWCYGVLEKSQTERDQSVSDDTEVPTSKEEVYIEEKEHDSLSSMNGGSSSDLSEQPVIKKDKSRGTICSEEKVLKEVIDVKKRVHDILVDSNLTRGDKSPRMQDLYVTTYDLISPASSPEKASSPIDEQKLVSRIFDSEAEEILRKQLAVEEEIKAITEQQQKEQLPLIYVREIPNKPPPPYTPPSALTGTPVKTIIPTSDEIEEITMYSAKILHKAYLSNNLINVNISNNTLSLISKDISKDCYKFVFDLCKDIARQHYKQFDEEDTPSWLRISKKVELALVKPFDTEGLKMHLIKKLKELFGYIKPHRRENAIIKWSRKKRDHVDEILVMECQQEEAQWTDYQKDELLVKDQLTNQILDSLLKETTDILAKIFLEKKCKN